MKNGYDLHKNLIWHTNLWKVLKYKQLLMKAADFNHNSQPNGNENHPECILTKERCRTT